MAPTFKTHLELEVRSPGGGVKTGFPGFGNRFDDQIPVVKIATGFRPLIDSKNHCVLFFIFRQNHPMFGPKSLILVEEMHFQLKCPNYP